jgi:adenylate cyclase
MKRGLKIRSKLAALVVVPVLLMLAVLGVMERVLERQLVAEADRRAEAGRDALQIELDDDLIDLRLALGQLAQSQRFRRAVQTTDAPSATAQAEAFAVAYPGLGVLVVEPGGNVLVSVGIEGLARLHEVQGLVLPSEPGRVEKMLLLHGCGDAIDVPARILMTPVASATIIACQRLDAAFLQNAATKLRMALALVDPSGEARLVAHTEGFPVDTPLPAPSRHRLHEAAGESWAVDRFCPKLVPDESDACALEALSAISVTQTRDIVRRDLLIVMGTVLLMGFVTLLLGGRIAFRMTTAIERIVNACRRLPAQEYTRIEPVRTGDELEELGEQFNEMVEGLEERDHLRTTFGKYMTESVMSHLMANKVQLGGDLLPVTVLFSDIRGFTATSERLDAQALVSLLNEYFTEMVEIVMDHGGVVDKYIGDAIMVVFGAPVPREDDPIRAVRAAIEMRRALARLNERLEKRGLAPIRTGIGIHTGDVVAGNIGCERRMEYTVIGDAVNLASRLEGCTKTMGADLVISEATQELVREHIDARFLREITVKGRERPVKVYAVPDPDDVPLNDSR